MSLKLEEFIEGLIKKEPKRLDSVEEVVNQTLRVAERIEDTLISMQRTMTRKVFEGASQAAHEGLCGSVNRLNKRLESLANTISAKLNVNALDPTTLDEEIARAEEAIASASDITVLTPEQISRREKMSRRAGMLLAIKAMRETAARIDGFVQSRGRG
jgi:uncharacterized protein YydD (DUF2326 family)